MKKDTKKKLTELCRTYGGDVFFEHPLSPYSSIGLGGEAAAWYAPSGLEALREAVVLLEARGEEIIVIGGATNVLIPDEGLEAIVIKLFGAFFEGITVKDNIVTAGAGCALGKLISKSCANGLGGLEGLAGIPGTLGGAIKMNASYEAQMCEKLSRVLVLEGCGEFVWKKREDMKFGYRSSSFEKKEIIVQAEFRLERTSCGELKEKFGEYLQKKMERQPLDKKTLGCIFKNPRENPFTSGELIEKAGMKGVKSGSAEISEKHANFIVNTGGAFSHQVIELIEMVQKKVKEVFDVYLEPEIEVLAGQNE